MTTRRDSLASEGDPRESDHVAAGRYLSTHERSAPSPLVPVLGLMLLVVVTSLAFFAQREPASGKSQTLPPSMTSQGALPAGAMPVAASYDERLATLEETLAAAPTDTAALRAMVDLMLAAHQPERALEYADDWLEVVPGSPDPLLQKVLVYTALEQWDEAIAVNRTLYEMEPARLLTRLNMGSLHANRGDADEARRWWNDLVRDAPESNEAKAAERALAQLAGESRS